MRDACTTRREVYCQSGPFGYAAKPQYASGTVTGIGTENEGVTILPFRNRHKTDAMSSLSRLLARVLPKPLKCLQLKCLINPTASKDAEPIPLPLCSRDGTNLLLASKI
jgi:hypothetical protein